MSRHKWLRDEDREALKSYLKNDSKSVADGIATRLGLNKNSFWERGDKE
jgi:hypothetical protein